MQFNGKENLCFFLLLETNIWSCLVLSGEQDVWGQMMSFFPSYVTTSRGLCPGCNLLKKIKKNISFREITLTIEYIVCKKYSKS